MRRISAKAQVSDDWIRNFWNKVDWIPKSRSHRNEISSEGYVIGKSEKYVY